MRSARWTILMGSGFLFAWIVFRPWAAWLGGVIALVAAIASYQSHPKGWTNLRRTLGDLALMNGIASILSIVSLWPPLAHLLFPTDHALEDAAYGHAFGVPQIGFPSFLLAVAFRMGLW